jgi:predicted amidohydrolase YtcJ
MDQDARVSAILNGKVYSHNQSAPIGTALVFEKGRFSFVGTDQDARCLLPATPAGVVLDVGQRAVFPGFIDTHLHLTATGLEQSAVDLYSARRVADILDLLSEEAESADPGAWVIGKQLDEALLEEGRPPNRPELDRAIPDHPVFLNDRGLHYVVLNSAAFQRLGLDLQGMAWNRGQEQGDSASGRFQEEAGGLARKRFAQTLSRSERIAAVRRGAEALARLGLTTVHAVEGGELSSDDDALLVLDLIDQLPIHVVLYWSTRAVRTVREAGLPRIGGDIFLDGSVGSRTAAFAERYADDGSTNGILLMSDGDIDRVIREADYAGMQLGVHAIGDLAIEKYLCALERLGVDARSNRHRIDHFGFPNELQIQRAAQLGVVIPTQPPFPFLRGGLSGVYEKRLGHQRAERGYPLRELVAAGLTVAGGSDSPVTPADPLLGLHSCVNHPVETQRLTLLEALKLYTINGAYLAFEEVERGAIAPGYVADCVVLDSDPFTSNSDAIRHTTVAATISEGRIVYERSNALQREEVA